MTTDPEREKLDFKLFQVFKLYNRGNTMKMLVNLIIAILLCSIGTAEAKRTQVRIVKPSPQPVVTPVVIVPVAFDLIRRTSCDPAIARSTGPGDPGFDPAGPRVGNFLIPAINRKNSYCYRPKD